LKWGFVGRPGIACFDRWADLEEVLLLGSAYRDAQNLVPSRVYDDPVERLNADRAFWAAFIEYPGVEGVVRSVCCLEGDLSFQEWFLGLWRDINAPLNSYGGQSPAAFEGALDRMLRIRECR
jgi:hypothetical protein